MPMFEGWTEPFSAERQALELEPVHIEGFRRCQALSYECAAAVANQLREGMTERDATEMMTQFMTDRGVHEYFHLPVAWFGDRTTLHFRSDREFFPTMRRLKAGDPFILDVAPVLDGHAADIGYSAALGENAIHAQMMQDLIEYRSLILDGVKAGRTRSAIYRDVDRLIEAQGYENRHQRYNGRVLGHRVTWTPERERSRRTFAGFGWPTMRLVLAMKVLSKFDKEFESPEWSDAKSSNFPVTPGLWAVEPHIGFRGVGAKWEEILVVTEHDAYWIDDNVPHMKQRSAVSYQRPAAHADGPAPQRVVNA
jgi:Xaa-Pro aminopeptidase